MTSVYTESFAFVLIPLFISGAITIIQLFADADGRFSKLMKIVLFLSIISILYGGYAAWNTYQEANLAKKESKDLKDNIAWIKQTLSKYGIQVKDSSKTIDFHVLNSVINKHFSQFIDVNQNQKIILNVKESPLIQNNGPANNNNYIGVFRVGDYTVKDENSNIKFSMDSVRIN